MDNQQRNEATDPSRSFIVQAPAGSGKTELLTQRYLRLLSQVSSPEQIVALTFTRKAASEMRERIIGALQRAADQIPADSPHQQLTERYALAALKHAQTLNWQILSQPHALKIMTIDALCQTLNQSIILNDEQIPHATVSEHPDTLYQETIRNWFAHVLEEEAFHEPLKVLLHHLDNRQDKLVILLSDLLKTREQWLPALYAANEQKKELFEEALSMIEQHTLTQFLTLLSAKDYNALQQLCVEFSQALTVHSPWLLLRQWTATQPFNRETAICLAHLLLTKDHKLRKGFDHHVGLKRDQLDKGVYEDLKTRSKTILNRLDETPGLLKSLIRIKQLPPAHFQPEQWHVLQALFTLLPLLAAHLHLTFCTKNQVDFTAISQQALLALGDELQPTDLALYLDWVTLAKITPLSETK